MTKGVVDLYEYKFIKISAQGFRIRKPKEDYHEIIHEHAKQGWRLVQVLISPTEQAGLVEYYELIFEK